MKNSKKSLIISDNIAIIKEQDCIGCTKCIRVCPVDAILGAAKQMHTIISHECTGCELCVASCPVSCITMSPIIKQYYTGQQNKITRAQQRFDFREFRLQRDKAEKIKTQGTIQTRRAAIQAALLRAKEKKTIQKNG